MLCLDGDRLAAIQSQHSYLALGQVERYANLETGFVAFNYLLQATALGLGAHFKTPLTAGEQSAVRSIAGLPSVDVPKVIVSLGSPGPTTLSADYVITTTSYSGTKPADGSTHAFDLDMLRTVPGPKDDQVDHYRYSLGVFRCSPDNC
jgi:hypothetical protein